MHHEMFRSNKIIAKNSNHSCANTTFEFFVCAFAQTTLEHIHVEARKKVKEKPTNAHSAIIACTQNNNHAQTYKEHNFFWVDFVQQRELCDQTIS